MSIKREQIKVYDMTCTSCENRVENSVKKLKGVLKAKASYSKEVVEVEYDDKLCSTSKIKNAVKSAGYSTQNSKDYKFMGILIIAAAIILLGLKTSGFDMDSKLANASYAVLFVVGVLTSLHCIGMCGGIMLSQSLSKNEGSKFQSIKPALLYNSGRVVSYTVLGGIIGALGSVLSLSIVTKAALEVFAGVFMIIMGLNMAGFSIFRKLNIRLPHAVCKVKNKSGSPFIVGLLNGLMPCGPLQTMQLYALGTGSPIKGALSMFMFSIGTVPLMLTFGILSGFLSKGYSKKILKLSGVLIVVLGLIMGSRGLTLAGINVNPASSLSKSLLGSNSNGASNPNIAKAVIKDGVQTITMSANNNGYTPNAFYVQKGIPVKWIIKGDQLNSCNSTIVVQALNKEKKLQSGENIIEFTPSKDINFSCWMGMIRGVIKVTDNLNSVDTSKADSSIPPASSGPSCCTGSAAGSSSSTGTTNQSSIYGNDLSIIPTSILVNKSQDNGEYQSAAFKGKGFELQPLIVVTGDSKKTKLTFDLSTFDNAEGQYFILDSITKEQVSSFTAVKGINEVEFAPKKAGGYAIARGNTVLGLIEVVDNVNTANLDDIRSKYLGD